MSICPFWSNKNEKIRCFDECVFVHDEDICPFKLYLDNSEIPLSKTLELDEDGLSEDF